MILDGCCGVGVMSETSEELEARIAAYIDGQLPSAEAARLEVFLANTDPQLAEQIIGMLADCHRLRSLPRGVAPADLAGRVMEQVERSSLLNDVDSGSQWRRPWWQSRRWGAVAALLMVGVFTYFVVMAVVGTGYNQRIRDMVANAGKPAARPVRRVWSGRSAPRRWIRAGPETWARWRWARTPAEAQAAWKRMDGAGVGDGQRGAGQAGSHEGWIRRGGL